MHHASRIHRHHRHILGDVGGGTGTAAADWRRRHLPTTRHARSFGRHSGLQCRSRQRARKAPQSQDRIGHGLRRDPQAVRNVLPDLVSNTVEVVKLTSPASVVALPEMLYSADMARSLTYNSSPIVLAALMYLVLLWPVVRLISRLEHRVGE